MRTAEIRLGYRLRRERAPAYIRNQAGSAYSDWHRGIAGNSRTDKLRWWQLRPPMSHPQRQFAMDEDAALREKPSSLVLRARYGNPRMWRGDSDPRQPARSMHAGYRRPKMDDLVSR
jgi:hypothetical protein